MKKQRKKKVISNQPAARRSANSERAETSEGMESIGKKLKREREKKGVSLDEVSSQTRVHHRVLTALEEDRFDELPSPTYVKAFLKRYAEYLGLDPEWIVEKYLATHPKAPEQVLILEGEEPEKVRLLRFALPVVGLLVGILILSLSSYYIIRWLASRPRKPAKEVAKVEEATFQAPARPSLPVAEPEPKVGVESLNLTVRTMAEVWLQVTADGKLIFQDILPPGEVESWQATEEIALRVGDAGAIELELNGKPLGSPGKPGQAIKNIIFTEEGMSVEGNQ